MTRSSPRVIHVITGLAPGGAETLLFRLLNELDPESRRGHQVVSLRPRWTLADDIEGLGVPVRALDMNGYPTPRTTRRLVQALRDSDAGVIQTWMLHSNVLGGAIARATTPRTPIAWGIHLTKVDPKTLGVKAALVQRCEAASSWLIPSSIVSCSLSSTRAMERMKYSKRKIETIPNGFDVNQFKPDPDARREIRKELGLGDDVVVVGHVARYHPVKDHATLLKAAHRVLDEHPKAHFVLCGNEVDSGNPRLRELVGDRGGQITMLGQRSDIPRLLNGFDVAVSSSSSEALSLSVGEAMATGVPVVATRSGDSEELVADTGVVTPIEDPTALASALGEIVALEPATRLELGRRARLRISASYSLAAMAASYMRLWEQLEAGIPKFF